MVKTYTYSGPVLGTRLAEVSRANSVLTYCGNTNEDGVGETVRAMTLSHTNNSKVFHYILNGEGRLVMAFTSVDGQNQSELHKLEYGTLDSVYYSVHQYNWDNGVNFLEYKTGFGKWGDKYQGTSLYGKSGTDAIDGVAPGVLLFSELAIQFQEIYADEFTSEHAENAARLNGMINLSAPNITEAVVENNEAYQCNAFDNIPNPNGTPENPNGSQDLCFDTNISAEVVFEVVWGEWMAILDISGGQEPYAISVNDSPFFPNFGNGIGIPDPGLYTFVIRDENGCLGTVAAIRPDECTDSDLALSLTSEPASANAEASGGTPPYSYQWDVNGETVSFQSISNLSAGTYTCTVTDADLCQVSDQITVEGKCAGESFLVDIDENSYAIVEIAGQCWMAENLRVTRYQNGAAVPTRVIDDNWANATVGYKCALDNDESNVPEYGYLYNVHAAQTSQNLCPEGWKVPTDAEFDYLIAQAGGNEVAGLNLKSTNIWDDSGTYEGPGNNSLGWDARPGGQRGGIFNDYDFYFNDEFAGSWHSSSVGNAGVGEYLRITTSEHSAYVSSNLEYTTGMSVRCIKE